MCLVLRKVERDANITRGRRHRLRRGLTYVPATSVASCQGKSFKKTVLPAEQLRPKLMRGRAWLRYQTRIDPHKLVWDAIRARTEPRNDQVRYQLHMVPKAGPL